MMEIKQAEAKDIIYNKIGHKICDRAKRYTIYGRNCVQFNFKDFDLVIERIVYREFPRLWDLKKRYRFYTIEGEWMARVCASLSGDDSFKKYLDITSFEALKDYIEIRIN